MFNLFEALVGVIGYGFITIVVTPLQQKLTIRLHRRETANNLLTELGFNRAKVQEWLRRINGLKEHSATDSRQLLSDNHWLDLSKISQDTYLRTAQNGELHYFFDNNALVDLKDFFSWCNPISECRQNCLVQQASIDQALLWINRWETILLQWHSNLSRIEAELRNRWKVVKRD